MDCPARPLALLLLLSLIACGGDPQPAQADPQAPASKRPNVLLISLDSVRADFLSCYGYRPQFAPERPTTPHLDRLAAEGARFERAYSSSSWTLASHMALITGQPDVVHGVEMDSMGLAPQRPTLAALLAEAGYATAGFYSGPYLDPRYGFARGFQRYEAAYGDELTAAAAAEVAAKAAVEAALAAGEDASAAMAAHGMANRRLEQLSHRDVSSERVSDGLLDALDAFEAEGDRPWLLFGHYFDPHFDYVPPPELAEAFDPDYAGDLHGRDFLVDPRLSVSDARPRNPYRRRRVASDRDWAHVLALYAAELAWTDAQVGRVLDALRERDLLDNTLVIVVADHGDEFFEHGHLGHRINLLEESIRVPLLVRYPGTVPAGTVVPGPVAAYDAFATVLAAAGLDLPGGTVAQDLVPLTRGEAARPHRPMARLVRALGERGPEGVSLRTIRVLEAFLDGDLKLLRTRGWSDPAGPVPVHISQSLIEASNQARATDLSLRWIDLAAHPTEPREAWSTDFSEPRAAAALARWQALYPQLTALRRTPVTVEKDAATAAQLESLGYGGGEDELGEAAELVDLFTLTPPGR